MSPRYRRDTLPELSNTLGVVYNHQSPETLHSSHNWSILKRVLAGLGRSECEHYPNHRICDSK